jgi:hypothetical protein
MKAKRLLCWRVAIDRGDCDRLQKLKLELEFFVMADDLGKHGPADRIRINVN